mmetsp:Transcript_16141/g.48141  ORF Transcript_16141/g.48141 Transcript_16141/m.48141 type:complete len:336 (+) Transcript_16141:130-1137(+)|eukprot:CAMPEP_0119261278 /NCGR_PEP_ID=MMETSP1329-20130426/1399_1 /TAXON_ID=114041 /ORGANISM="Genus nov. species nov., Strain RCC1024" /LENGTH=335 /DNA_ID=CAMNT_0007260819 /DNA_START=77 /DNA_END=1084 /DNA_ORIENTATION=-
MVHISAAAALLGIFGRLKQAMGEFAFLDFNTTLGLRLNGDASHSACGDDDSAYAIRARSRDQGTLVCKGRIRLTPSRQSQVGSAWYHAPQPVQDGFESLFTFRITGQSRHCLSHRDLDFSLNQYERCAVQGGDGLAFVVHNHRNGSSLLSGSGSDLGYGGLSASIAVELDTNYSPHRGSFMGDAAPVDHVELRSRGTAPNAAAGENALLAPVVYHNIADGREHVVKVQYVPQVEPAYFRHLSAYPAAARFMVDDGEHRRLGLFLVFIDDGIILDDPSIAVPLNLHEMLDLPGDGSAYFGLTAATGHRWQTHDLTSWYVCDRPGCGAPADESQGIV